MRVSVVGKFDFLMDEKYMFLTKICSFCMRNGYVAITINKQNIGLFGKYGFKLRKHANLHRLIYMLEHDVVLEQDQHIDHVDRSKFNNKVDNLRMVTQSQNSKNRELRTGQVYYNICYNKFMNNFTFRYKEVNHTRCFNQLQDALNYFKEYDEKNDFVLTKHIPDLKPIEEVELFSIHPPLICDCGASVMSKRSLIRHKKNHCPL